MRRPAARQPRSVQLRRLLRGCEVIALTEQAAHAAGQLLGRSGTSDIAGAAVAQAAADRNADVVTSDPGDIKRLLHAARSASRIIAV